MRPDRDRILDMIEMCDLLLEHASGEQRRGHDPVIQAAAERWIEVLGEAASKMSDQVKTDHPEIPWRDITGIRVILAHAYFHIEPDVIANVIDDDVPVLRGKLQQIADSLSDVD